MTKAMTKANAPYDAVKVAEAIAGGEYALDVVDAETAAREIVARILEAADADSVAAFGTTVSATEILNRPIAIRGVRFMGSAFEGDGPSVYALLDVADGETGEALVVTCGSRNVMAQVLRLDQLGVLPTEAVWRIVQAERATAAGFYPLWLAKAEG